MRGVSQDAIPGVNRLLPEAVNGGDTRIAASPTNPQEVRQEAEKEAEDRASLFSQ